MSHTITCENNIADWIARQSVRSFLRSILLDEQLIRLDCLLAPLSKTRVVEDVRHVDVGLVP